MSTVGAVLGPGRAVRPEVDAQPHLLIVVNTDWFFLSHRLPIARAAREAGMRVGVVAPDTGRSDEIRSEGFEFHPLPLSRKGTSPLAEWGTIRFLVELYRSLRPDLVHHVTSKPVVYGSLAARLVPGLRVVNAVSGLGYVFISDRGRALRAAVRALYGIALKGRGSRTIFQNPDDRDLFLSLGLVRPRECVLIRGSGVDCAEFPYAAEPEGVPIVLLPARMLWDKGVGEFVSAARELKGRGVEARFVLAGREDDGNPAAVPADQLERWVAEGVVEWWGHRTDMPAVLAASSVVVLPSEREGLPKALLEAAATGRAIVTTDVPGCREVVEAEVNGLLVPPRDPVALASAIERLIRSPELRREYGLAGRRRAESEFAIEAVVAQTLRVYADLVPSARRFAPPPGHG